MDQPILHLNIILRCRPYPKVNHGILLAAHENDGHNAYTQNDFYLIQVYTEFLYT